MRRLADGHRIEAAVEGAHVAHEYAGRLLSLGRRPQEVGDAHRCALVPQCGLRVAVEGKGARHERVRERHDGAAEQEDGHRHRVPM